MVPGRDFLFTCLPHERDNNDRVASLFLELKLIRELCMARLSDL